MRGDRTVYVLREPAKDWQGDPIPGSEPLRQLVAHDCAYIPKTNADDGSLVAGEGLLVVFPGAKAVPRPEDSLEISLEEGVWQIDGDVAPYTKGGQPRAWMMNVRTQR